MKATIIFLINGEPTTNLYIPSLSYQRPHSFFITYFTYLLNTNEREWVQPSIIQEENRKLAVLDWLHLSSTLNSIRVYVKLPPKENQITVQAHGQWTYGNEEQKPFQPTNPVTYFNGFNFLDPANPEVPFSNFLFELYNFHVFNYDPKLIGIKNITTSIKNYDTNQKLTELNILFNNKPLLSRSPQEISQMV